MERGWEKILQKLAQTNAIKIGKVMPEKEMIQLVDDLFLCKMPMCQFIINLLHYF